MRFIADGMSINTYLNVMGQCYPAGKVSAERYRELNRHGKAVTRSGGPASLYGLPKDPNNHQRLHADQSGLQTARYLVDNITRLSKLLKEDPSPGPCLGY